jgi:hypothetical protein
VVTRPRPGSRARRAAGRLARRVVTVAAAVGLVVVVRVLLGVWVTAALLAVAAVAGLLAGWAAVEARAFPRPGAGTPVARGPGAGPADHVAFARELAVVAAAYLSECERQEGNQR